MKRTILAGAAALGLSSGGASALEILHYDDHGAGLVQAALVQLGESATEIDQDDDLAASLGSQAWDVVIIDSSANGLSDPAAVSSYVQDGGAVILSYWDTQDLPALAADFQVTVENSYSSPQDINQWLADPMFTTPFPVSDPIAGFIDDFSDDGDEFSVLPGGLAVAGFSAAPSSDRAGIVVGNEGRTIINGWLFGNWDGSDGEVVNLVANQIATLGEARAPAPSSEIPLPAAAPLLAAGLGGLVLARRRRKR
ncbi:MAG: VPLPA-CTERM sorting domain-containing protein [Pseudomonadota bacterium]